MKRKAKVTKKTAPGAMPASGNASENDRKFDRLVAAFCNAVDPNQAVYSDRGRINPMLGNRANAATAKTFPPTSGMTGVDRNQDPDYFRQQALPPGKYPTDPDPSITTGRVTMSVRMRWNPIKGLTFERLVGYLEQFQLGYYRMPGMTWDAMERRDYQIKGDAGKRKKAIAKNGYAILTIPNVPESDTALAEEQKEFLENFYEKLQCTSAIKPDEEGGALLLMRQMMDAHLKFYAIHEIIWQPAADGSLTAKLINVPLWWVEGTRGKLRFLQSEFSIYGIDMDPGEWLVTCGDGLMEALSIIYLFKNLPLKSWLSMLDRLGSGGLIGKTTAAFNSPEWENFREALKDFSEDWSGVFSTSADVSLLEARNVTGAGPFYALIELMDRAITSLLRGSSLATKTSGADEQGASIQLEESHIFEADDAELITETLKMKLSRYALAWKFGPDAPQYAYIQVKTTPRQDVANDVAVDAFLAPFGLLEEKTTLERYGRPLPDKGAKILKSAAQSDPSDPSDPSKPKIDPKTGQAILPDPEKEAGSASQFANAAPADVSEKLVAGTAGQFAAALHDDLAHAAQKVMAILQIEDETLREKKLKDLLDQWPGITADTLAAPESAGVLANAIATAYAHGLQSGSAQITNAFYGHAGRPGQVGGSSPGGGSHAGAVGKLKDVMSGKLDEAAYAKVSPETAAKIKAATGIDATGHQHFIDRDTLVHINRQHGVGNEDQPGHEPVTADDIEKIPHIVEHADSVKSGGKSARNLPSVIYGKRENGTTYYVEEHWAKEKVLAGKTMWKIKTPGNSATPGGGVSHTSETSGATGT